MSLVDMPGILLIDVQEKLFPHIEGALKLERGWLQAIEACKLLKIPILVTEQYPQGLGPTLRSLKNKLPSDTPFYEKTTFSCLKDPTFKASFEKYPMHHWVVIGLEAHICVLQTAFDLLEMGKDVMVMEDLIGSRFPHHKEIALKEMHSRSIRISSLETFLFELLHDAKNPLFKKVQPLFK